MNIMIKYAINKYGSIKRHKRDKNAQNNFNRLINVTRIEERDSRAQPSLGLAQTHDPKALIWP